MRFLNYTAATPPEDLALEEALHLCVEEGISPNTWRIWQPLETTVVIGTGQEAALEVQLELARAEHVRVVRRHSGGGAVVIGPGTINFSAFYRLADLPGSETIRGAMYAALAPLIEWLTQQGLNVRDAGYSDLAILEPDGTLRKLAGNSQARKRRSVVVHGTLLADPDWARIERLLRYPSSIPDYRAGRGHREFLTSLKETGAPHDFATLARELPGHLAADTVQTREPSVEERQRVHILLAEKYSRDDWHFRR